MQLSSSARQAGGKRPPAVATPTSAVVGPNASASSTVPTIGKPSSVSPARSESSSATTSLGPVAHDAARGLAVVRVARVALGEDQRAYAGLTPRPGPFGGELDTVGELDPGPRVVGEQQVPVEVDVVAEARDVRAGGDPEARLDHAAEHDAEPERARRVRHRAPPRGCRPTSRA